MKLENLRVGHVNIPPASGSLASIQLLPTDQEQGGGLTIQAPREWMLKLIAELADLKLVTLTIEGPSESEAPKEAND